MPNPSNLYAEKIFAEHPIALWALDDELNYISLIKEADRDLSSWTVSGGSGVLDSSLQDDPFPNSYTTKILGDVVAEGILGQIQAISSNTLGISGISKTNLNSDLGTFSIGFYLYADNPYLTSVELGYRYYDNLLSTYIEPKTKTFPISIEGRWMLISETFEIPNTESPIEIIIRIGYVGGSETQEGNAFYVNGLSVGQWSENFSSESLGVSIQDLPAEIPLNNFKAVVASSYGLQDFPGYYITSSNEMFAKNASLPMVYGTSNVTVLSPNNNNPSLIIPGSGFLNEYGRFKDYTLEMWMKISSDTVEPKRIVGPISSTDGLYVDGPFLQLKIGNSIGSFYVSEWFRPMLIDLRVSYDSASVLINGEEVIAISINESHAYPSRFIENKDHDWIGFYSHEDASPIEIDCVAIYPYIVSQIVAKRRWAYGQAVEVPENINRSYSGTSTVIDYQFSKYANNYIYPDIGKWEQGITDNFIIENNEMSIPNYSLPQIVFNNKTLDSWNTDLSAVQESDRFISLQPSSSWNSTDGYIFFNTLNLLSSDTKAIYGIFSQPVVDSSTQTLIKIVDDVTSSYFEIRLSTDSIDYVLKYEDYEEIVYATQKYYPQQKFIAGIDIEEFVRTFGGNLGSFFGRKPALSVYVGGNKEFQNTFSGKIFNVSFASERNLSKISYAFNDSGVASDSLEFIDLSDGMVLDGGEYNTTSWNYEINGTSEHSQPAIQPSLNLAEHTASYTLKINKKLDSYFLDIYTDSYWEDYIPLSYLGKYVLDHSGNKVQSLDFVQFNINYPAPSKFMETETLSSWSYDELAEDFSNPIQRDYDDLGNFLFSGFEDYQDLATKSVKSYAYDTSSSILRSYVTFQYVAEGVSKSYQYFSNLEPASNSGIVRPGILGEDWEVTKYEVVDGMIIYPPNGVDFKDLAITVHVEATVDGIVQKPIKIRKLQMASVALNHSTPNAIGTRFGQDVYPYRKTGLYFDYKGINPFSIYKGSSPHLYTTRNSGIEIRGEYDPAVSRGISIPVNVGEAEDFKVIASQIALRYDKDFFPYAPVKLFEIQGKNTYLKFYAIANHPSGKRAKIYAINAKTGRLENGIAFYWNGKLTREPNITIKEWGMLGIRFASSIDFRNYVGAIRLTGPLLFNNISHYQSTNLQEVQEITTRPWIRVKTSISNTLDWTYWDTAFIWNDVLIISETSYYGVDPANIYKSYTGTNKIIIDDIRPFRLNSYQYIVRKDIRSESLIRSAV